MRNIGIRLTMACLLAWSALDGAVARAQPRRPAPKPNAGEVASPKNRAPGQEKPLASEPPEASALRKAADDYSKAFNARDFAAMANQWTAMAELHQDNGTTIRGRDAIMAMIKNTAAHRPKSTISIAVESVDMLGNGVGRVRGTLTLKDDAEIGGWTTRFNSLRVLEEGQWRLADTRETSIATATIEDLSWLAGSWTANGPMGQVTVTYEKTLGDKGLLGKISLKPATGPATEALEIIQARDGELRSWVFDSTGLSGEGYWEHDGARFNRTIHGTTADGRPASSVVVLTRASADTCLWHPIERLRGADRLPDLPTIKLTKTK